MPDSTLRITVEPTVDGYFIGSGPFDDSGFVSNEAIDHARSYLDSVNAPNVNDREIALIIASFVRGDR